MAVAKTLLVAVALTSWASTAHAQVYGVGSTLTTTMQGNGPSGYNKEVLMSCSTGDSVGATQVSCVERVGPGVSQTDLFGACSADYNNHVLSNGQGTVQNGEVTDLNGQVVSTQCFKFANLHHDNRACPTVTVVASYNHRCSYGYYQADNFAALSVQHPGKTTFIATAQNQNLLDAFNTQFGTTTNDNVLFINDIGDEFQSTASSNQDQTMFNIFPAYLVLDHTLTVQGYFGAGNGIPWSNIQNNDLSVVQTAVNNAVNNLPDTTPSLVSITAAVTGTTSQTTNSWEIVFDRPVSMTASDVVLADGGTGMAFSSFTASSDQKTFTYATEIVASAASSGTYSVSLSLSSILDVCNPSVSVLAAGVPYTNLAVQYQFDATTCAITSMYGIPSRQSSQVVYLTFPSAVTGFDQQDVQITDTGTGATISSFGTTSTTGQYQVQITGIVASGTYTVHVVSGSALDSAGMPIGSSSMAFDVDLVAPTVQVSLDNPSPTESNVTDNRLVFSFSEPTTRGSTPISGIVSLDPSVTGAMLGSRYETTDSSGMVTAVTVHILGVDNLGTYRVTLNSVYQDAAGNLNSRTDVEVKKGLSPSCATAGSCCVPQFGAASSLAPQVGPEDTAWPVDYAGNGAALNFVRDVAYNPMYNQLYLANSATDDVTIVDLQPGSGVPMRRIRDRGSYHYMANISSLSFDSKGHFAVCNENPNDYNGQMVPNYFMGPTLYNSSLAYPNVVSQGSEPCNTETDICYWVHSDMLHEAPNCMGIEHDGGASAVDPHGHIYWAFDGHHSHLVRFNFRQPHGPFDMDHAEATVMRFPLIQLTRVPGVPGHMVLHAASRQLYISDPGGMRIIQMDTLDIGEPARDSCLAYPIYSSRDPRFAYITYECSTHMTWKNMSTRGMPSGMAQHGNTLFVGLHDTGEIIAYDMRSGAELGVLNTGSAGSLYGLEVVQDQLYYVNGTHLVHVVQSVQCPSVTDDSSPPVAPPRSTSCTVANLGYTALTETCNTQIHPDMAMPGYGNVPYLGVYDDRTDCENINFDALLLSGYHCHPCLPIDPCYNGGTCAMDWSIFVEPWLGPNTTTGFTCNCPLGYSGDHCQHKTGIPTCDTANTASQPMISAKVLHMAGVRVDELPVDNICVTA